jgi:thioredoxin reductase
VVDAGARTRGSSGSAARRGPAVRDQPLGVLAGTPEAMAHAQIIRQWSDGVVFFAQGDALTDEQREQLAARGIRVIHTAVTSLIVEADRLTGVELENGKAVPRTTGFIRPRLVVL